MTITSKISMDLQRRGITPYIDAVQNEANTRAIELTLTDGDESWAIPAGVSAAVAYRKSDGTAGLYDTLPDGSAAVTLSGSTVTAILAEQVLTVPGTVMLAIILRDESLNRLSSFAICLLVEPDPASGAVKSENYYNYQTLGQLNAGIGSLHSALHGLMAHADSLFAQLAAPSRNLFDPQTPIAVGGYDSRSTDVSHIIAVSNGNMRCFIQPVRPETTYTLSQVMYYAVFFDGAGKYIGYERLSDSSADVTLTTPPGCYYLGVSYVATKTGPETMQVVRGDALPEGYVPFGAALQPWVPLSDAQRQGVSDIVLQSRRPGVLLQELRTLPSNTYIDESTLQAGDKVYFYCELPGLTDPASVCLRMYNWLEKPYTRLRGDLRQLYGDVYMAELTYTPMDGCVLAVTNSTGTDLTPRSAYVSRYNLLSGEAMPVFLNPGDDIQAALDGGAGVLVLAPGDYGPQTVNLTGQNIRITVADSGYDARLPKKNAVLNNAIDLAVTGGELLTAPFTAAEDSNWYKVFVSGELAPEREGKRSATYNAILWECDDTDPAGDCKLQPVLTLQSCEQTPGSFFYDHTQGLVFIHPVSFTDQTVYRRLAVEEGSLFTARGVRGLYLENIAVRYAPEAVTFSDVSGLEAAACTVSHTAYGSGFSLEGTNGVLRRCQAHHVCADGFAIGAPGGGHTQFHDCSGHHCGDDGISHHNGATGAIYGGEWHHNGKGGIAPAHGSVVDVYSAVCHDNWAGFYAESDENEPAALGRQLHFSNCVAYGNTYGLTLRNYRLVSTGCSYLGNETPIWQRGQEAYTGHIQLGLGGAGGGLTITDDGSGNVTVASGGTVSVTDDGNGNVAIL